MDKADAILAHSMAFDAALFGRKADYHCAKSGLVHCPNSYSYLLCFKLDGDQHVRSFRHRNARYEYFHPDARATHGGYLDFDVRMIDGTRRLLFVTSCLHLHKPVEEAMIEGAEAEASRLKAKFEVWTELELFGESPAYARSVLLYFVNQRWKEFPDEQPEEPKPTSPQPKWPVRR